MSYSKTITTKLSDLVIVVFFNSNSFKQNLWNQCIRVQSQYTQDVGFLC